MLAKDMIYGRCQHVRAHHHSGAAASRSVVHGTVFVGRKVADLHRIQRPDAVVERPTGETLAERTGKHLRIERKDVGLP